MLKHFLSAFVTTLLLRAKGLMESMFILCVHLYILKWSKSQQSELKGGLGWLLAFPCVRLSIFSHH